MITAIVFDVDDTIYDQQAPYRIAMEKCFPDFDMSVMNQAYIRFRHYSDVGFPRVMAGVDHRIFPILALQGNTA